MYKCHIFFAYIYIYINIRNLLIVNIKKFWMKFISMISVFWSLHRRNDFRPQISNFVILQAMKQQGWLSQLVRRTQAKASLYKYRSWSRVKLEQSANYESTTYNASFQCHGFERDIGGWVRVVFEDNWNFLRNWTTRVSLRVFNCFNYLFIIYYNFIYKNFPHMFILTFVWHSYLLANVF